MPRTADPNVNFKPTRWFAFFRFLKAHVNGDGLAKELKLFMEENRMSLGNQFRSTDLVAMENFLSARALMDETLQGEVFEKARKILGPVSSLTKSVDQLRAFQRYTIYSEVGVLDWAMGYFFPHENPDKPVWVGIELWSNPRAVAHSELIQAFRGWIDKSRGSWSAVQLDNGWSGIRKGKAIHGLIGGDDHVRAVKDHLLQLLDEVGQFQKTCPGLPWAKSDAEAQPEQNSSASTLEP